MALIPSNWRPGYIPKQIITIILCIFAVIISYADRSNMSIAIVYMAKEFNWDHSIQGYILSSFYFGYFASQIIGGVLADKFGGRRVLGVAAATWTLFTLLTPISARINIYCLILCRICLGIGEGACFPSILSLISKWFPPEEQSRAVSTIFVSIFIGMAIAMPISNMLGSSQFGWASIFCDPRDYSGISKEELNWILESKSSFYSEDNIENYQSGSRENIMITDDDRSILQNENDALLPKNQISSRHHDIHKIPWKLILSRREVWAILLGQFFNAWGYFILLNWLPIFYYEYFHVDINLIGYYTALPYFLYIIMGLTSGYICDYAIHQLKIRVLTVRRSVNLIGTLGIAISLLFVTYLAKTSLQGLLTITIGYVLYSFQVSSINVSQMEIAPKYAGLITGLSNTCGAVPAFFGVALTGWILEITGNDWSIIWSMCSLFYIFEALFFVCLAGGELNLSGKPPKYAISIYHSNINHNNGMQSYSIIIFLGVPARIAKTVLPELRTPMIKLFL
ncbi:MFS general substrate transporter [Gigaspora margarita]|uniref:MFS general substrate transporter n=1 Tax=Gigaspora margarita TaxID=4874 RepID=A0A8H4EL24_GIGMA|nr:MFS general substrate transporter [Gigaspora margarita]